jgi:hypothetical protein
MSDSENRIASLEASIDELLSEIQCIKLEVFAAQGGSDAAAPLLEQRLQKIESAVGFLELSQSVSL